MVIQEQGWRGTSDLISGRNSKYPGIYNHFNVGAYTADGMTKIIRGLWWAKGAGVGATTFGRPWNSIEKSLTGGAMHYGAGYIDNDQYTYYTKKFNVMNGLGELSSHQYMTNIDGACSEGRLLRQAYTADDTKLVFRIPVYTGMPTAVCPAP
jgi:beta-N-acetylglucosaminidase